jgi:hypothetical protein
MVMVQNVEVLFAKLQGNGNWAQNATELSNSFPLHIKTLKEVCALGSSCKFFLLSIRHGI